MVDSAGPYNLDSHRPVFTPDNLVAPVTVTPTFYEDLDKHFANFADHILVQQFTWDTAWPTWEIHPKGDELIIFISGDTDFVLWIDGEEQIVRVNEPNSYIVVPANTWHTARPHKETTMLFITPGEGTLNTESPS